MCADVLVSVDLCCWSRTATLSIEHSAYFFLRNTKHAAGWTFWPTARAMLIDITTAASTAVVARGFQVRIRSIRLLCNMSPTTFDCHKCPLFRKPHRDVVSGKVDIRFVKLHPNPHPKTNLTARRTTEQQHSSRSRYTAPSQAGRT